MGVDKKLKDIDRQVASLERKLDGDGGGDDSLVPARKTAGSDAQILKKVSTRLQDFEAQITAQLSNMQSDFDKKLSHVNRGQSTMKPLDATGAAAGLDNGGRFGPAEVRRRRIERPPQQQQGRGESRAPHRVG